MVLNPVEYGAFSIQKVYSRTRLSETFEHAGINVGRHSFYTSASLAKRRASVRTVG
jgi:hypothetical protein